MEGFNEQVVRRKNKPKNIIIKIIAVLMLLLVPSICIVLAYIITTYMIYVGLFLFLIGIYLVWYVFTSQKVDYEYSVTGNELEISKIISLRKRKRVCKVNINEIQILGMGEKIIKGMRFSKTFIATDDISNYDGNYYAVFNDVAYGKCLLIFAPNEQILQGMKSHLNKDIVLKLFYNRSAG